jgi:cysteine desulfurase
MFNPAYFDHNATTPLDPAVLAAMLPWLESRFGNASSRHEYGRAARRAIDEARQQVAAAVNAHPTEVVFTSGGSEANNLFLKGSAACCRPGVIAVGATEHPCVLKPAPSWRVAAGRSRRLRSTRRGRWISTRFPGSWRRVRDCGRSCGQQRNRGHPGHSASGDGSQTRGRMVPQRRGAGPGQVAARFPGAQRGRRPRHDPFGAQGRRAEGRGGAGSRQAGRTAAADRRRRTRARTALGHRERPGHRRLWRGGGTCGATRCRSAGRLRVLRERLESGLAELGVRIFGGEAGRLPNTTYFAAPGIDGETLVGKLDRAGFAVASGAACSSANPEPSHVLLRWAWRRTWRAARSGSVWAPATARRKSTLSSMPCRLRSDACRD